jgi:HEPN domain-containing protein
MSSRLSSSATVLEQIAAIVSGCSYDPRHDMHFIDPKTVPLNQWNRYGEYHCPKSVSTVCPHCNGKVFLEVIPHGNSYNPLIRSLAAGGKCPGCVEEKPIQIFLVETSNNPDSPLCQEIWVNPPVKHRSLIVDTLPEKRIFRAYKNAIETFNAGMWAPSLVSCGRVVEGIAKTTFPNAKSTKQIKPLFNKLGSELKKIEEFRPLLDPLLGLGEALGLGRNPGGHFDLEEEPDRDLADKVIDLTEFLIQYVYQIVDEADEVKKLIAKLKPNDTEEEDLDEADLIDGTSESDPSPKT